MDKLLPRTGIVRAAQSRLENPVSDVPTLLSIVFFFLSLVFYPLPSFPPTLCVISGPGLMPPTHLPLPDEGRSSVVRVLVLAGADLKATDNHGNVPGARFQALSYLR